MVVNLAGSSQVAPTYWLNPQNGVSYPIVMQTPQYRLDSLAALANMPISGTRRRLAAGARRHRRFHAHARQRDRQPVRHPVDGADQRDRAGSRSRRGRRRHPQGARRHREAGAARARPSRCSARCARWRAAFSGLLFGLLGAIVLIYLLIVVNFQSWTDPFVIITALPAALAGIVWMLFATYTHAVGAGADRRDHVHGRRDREQRAGDQLRARAARRARRCRRRPRSKPASCASARC